MKTEELKIKKNKNIKFDLIFFSNGIFISYFIFINIKNNR